MKKKRGSIQTKKFESFLANLFCRLPLHCHAVRRDGARGDTPREREMERENEEESGSVTFLLL